MRRKMYRVGLRNNDSSEKKRLNLNPPDYSPAVGGGTFNWESSLSLSLSLYNGT